MVLVDFENRGMAIIRLCVSQSRQNIDGGPRRTLLYKRISNIQVLIRGEGSPDLIRDSPAGAQRAA